MNKDKVSQYFNTHAVEWGRHYRGAGIALRLFNRVFRKALKQRWDITMKHALPAVGKTYLDIGCGTGEYSLALVRIGATKVTGVDFAPAMIQRSRQYALDQDTDDRCDFLEGDFVHMDFEQKYDMVFAIGVFDYIEDHEAFWQKMISVSNSIVLGSFPGHSMVREPLRRLRYRRKGLPVHFYSRDQVTSLGTAPELGSYELETIGAGFVLTGFVR